MADSIPPFLLFEFPVLLPHHAALNFSDDEFDAFIKRDIAAKAVPGGSDEGQDDDDSMTLISTPPTTTADIRELLQDIHVKDESNAVASARHQAGEFSGHPFVRGLANFGNDPQPSLENMMYTTNGGLALASTKSALVDLFFELEDQISGPRLRELLAAAWREDPSITLKVIFNARSIHLGKASRYTFYRAVGWLAQNHPLTLVSNLRWLTRPIIEKPKSERQKEKEDEEMVFVETDKSDDDPTRFDARDGLAHGYWKDLLNILALAVNGKLDGLADPHEVLNVYKRKNYSRGKDKDESDLTEMKKQIRNERHSRAVEAFKENATYRALHLTAARLFAEQLKVDLTLLRKGDKASLKQISLCAKWAPSQKLFHDKHTFVVSSISEILHPQAEYDSALDRERYLRSARESYRKDVSALRKALQVVERDMSAKTFENIKYDHVPSLAMNNYAKIFMRKDKQRFDSYLDTVASGKRKISGATLLPSKLVKMAKETCRGVGWRGTIKATVEEKMNSRLVDGQWKTLVQRIKDSGTLESSIAVCDVSGSMLRPLLHDGTTPMDSSIALSLLVAEVTKPPFGGHIITFSEKPNFVKIELETSLIDKVGQVERSNWSMNTNFVSVFEDLILPMAVKNKLKQEDMVKQVFVFSDMQFDHAERSGQRWSTSFERIQKLYAAHGYEMPTMVFWNLAGGANRTSVAPGPADCLVLWNLGSSDKGTNVAPKPVGSAQPGTALVSGYSQGMLKVFMTGGQFDKVDDAEDEAGDGGGDDAATLVVQEEKEGGEVVVEVEEKQAAKKRKTDPMATLMKTVSHPAYSMLWVMD